MKNITILVPVYGDWESLKLCIESLKKYKQQSDKVMLINDCGPEVETIEQSILDATEGYEDFMYFRNKKNLGFVGTCNRGVHELDKGKNDILLLNSDTEVTENFSSEMQSVLYEDDKNGVVSPRSNNATLATIPLRSAGQKGIERDESYKLYKKMKSNLETKVEVPVAHGFCMLIRRELIKKFGLFDEVFGKGYGEEVDFCMRIRNNGYRCLLANRAYVFHLEARSFSLEKKKEMLETNNKIIWERYPNYRDEVRIYMNSRIEIENSIESSVVGGQKSVSLKLRNLLAKNKFARKIYEKLIQ